MLAWRQPARLLFGRGAVAELPALLAEIGGSRPLLVTDPGVVEAGVAPRVAALLQDAGLDTAVWDGAAPEADERHAEGCARRILAGRHDAVVALGGGSVLDAAKIGAVLATNGGVTADYFGSGRARRAGVPLVAVPTTPGSGGEVSSHAVVIARAAARKKELVAGAHLLPRAALTDPDLFATLPRERVGWCALDSLVHAVEALVARRATPWTDLHARLAVPAIAASLRRLLGGPPRPPASRPYRAAVPAATATEAAGAVTGSSAAAGATTAGAAGAAKAPGAAAGGEAASAPTGLAAATGAPVGEQAGEDRAELALGCLHAGLAMANCNAGAIHALGYPLTANYGIPHGLANALVAPAALERTWQGLPERYAEVARLLGAALAGSGAAGSAAVATAGDATATAASGLGGLFRALVAEIRVNGPLAGWGVVERDLPRLAAEAVLFRPVLENTHTRLTESDLLAIYRAVWSGGHPPAQ